MAPHVPEGSATQQGPTDYSPIQAAFAKFLQAHKDGCSAGQPLLTEKNPLPRQKGEKTEDAKNRLGETVKNLNRLLPADSIRFRCNSTRTQVAWYYAPPQRTPRHKRRRKS